jgi:hypothetical protein
MKQYHCHSKNNFIYVLHKLASDNKLARAKNYSKRSPLEDVGT